MDDKLLNINYDIEPIIYTKAIDFKSLDELKKITDMDELYDVIGEFRFKGYEFLYRGLSDSSYKLLPTISWNNKDYSMEANILEDAKSICIKYGIDKYKLPNANENLFYMGICRHLGLYSRLIDWTAGFWTAISFLMDAKNIEKDGVLWILAMLRNGNNFENIDPFTDDDKVHILKEDFFLPEENVDIRSLPLGLLRRWRQNGYFTVQPQSTIYTPLNEIKLPDEMRLIKITISSSEKNILLKNEKIISENELIVDNNHPILKEIEELNRKFI